MKMLFVDNFDNPESIEEIDVFTRDDFYWDNRYSVAHVFPLSAKAEVLAICVERNRLRKEYDDSVSLIFELRNKVSRGEYK